MKRFRSSLMAACVGVCLATGALAQEPAKPAAPPKGEAVVASTEVTATVAKVDQTTREVTLKGEDGKEYSFVAGDAVKNLAQVKPGDMVVVAYTEALAYEVKKGGKAAPAETTLAAGAAQPGTRPAGAIAQQTTVTVAITAIDAKAPSVTFQGPKGKTRTIKVKDPAKLQGVNVGDTVEITYTEAIAIKVEKAPKT